jgi:hypothetical protein
MKTSESFVLVGEAQRKSMVANSRLAQVMQLFLILANLGSSHFRAGSGTKKL